MSRPARVALTAFVLSCAMGLTGLIFQESSAPGELSAYATKIETVGSDVRSGFTLNLTREDILRNPKLEADRAALLEKIAKYQAKTEASESEGDQSTN